jgi:hypothetical protein
MRSDRYAARVAGFMFLFLIATVGAISVFVDRLEEDEISETLRHVSDNEFGVRVGVVLLIVAAVSTLILAAMLYAVTKHEDRNLAILALSCRAVEAALYAAGITKALTLLSLSDGTAGAGELASAHGLGAFVIDVDSWSTDIGASFFAVGSTLYAYLLLRGRSIPVPLARLGLFASLVLVVGVPLQTAAGNTTTEGSSLAIWIPMFAFEIATGLWLLIKGGGHRLGSASCEVAYPSSASPSRSP